MKRLWAPWRMQFILNLVKGGGCTLCEIANARDDEAGLVVRRSSLSYVVLNKYPYNSGHLMVVPKRHTADFAELNDEELLDLQRMIRASVAALDKTYHPQGYNIGMNLGQAGGAGIRDHMHYHILPRWNGDTNYLPAFGDTKVLPETLEETYRRLVPAFR